MTTEQFTTWAGARRLPDRLNPQQISQLETYVRVLSEWNARLNLTGFSLDDDLPSALDRLVLEPVLAATHITEGVRSLIDIGSGSGSPAIPLLVAAPWLELTMVESKQRKSVFLREAVRAIGMRATVANIRVEDVAGSRSNTPFSAASLRGVRLDDTIVAAIRSLISPGSPVFYFDSTIADPISPNGLSEPETQLFPELPSFKLSIYRLS